MKKFYRVKQIDNKFYPQFKIMGIFYTYYGDEDYNVYFDTLAEAWKFLESYMKTKPKIIKYHYD